jgi:hypothetical protein
MKYFAYGSNLHPKRFKERVPSGEFLALAALTRHALRFHKRGQDGSGKCNALFTGNPTDRIIGAIYEMAPGEKPGLDLAEGLGKGYNLRLQRLWAGDTVHKVFFYQADLGFIDDTLKPFTWYKDLVVNGCHAHGLPLSYIRPIENIEAIHDPDWHRTAMHLRILDQANHGGR